MSLTPGTRVGAYQVLGRLGAGGMGEVFRAHDTSLARDVALKSLPEGFATQQDRVALFQREAKVLASLNHPNIAAIYGLETSSPTPVLVLELVEGETLTERLQRGPMPLEEALEIARQIAVALEAAHGHGVVHRDLKPGNIKVTPGGQVKVLDFGLAKALRPEVKSGSGWSSMSHSPTWTYDSAAGAIVGTAGYMSPEQARGRTVDKRTDLWAFGVVLYEMLAGRRAFQREDTTETLAAVLRDDVDWSALPAETPAIVRRLLRRCLERDPRKRLRDAGDAELDLAEVLAGPGSEAGGEGEAARRRAAPWQALAAAAVASAALGAGVAWLALRSTEPLPRLASRFEIATPPEVHLEELAISPDGRTIAFAGRRGAQRQLYLRRLDQFEAQPLPGTDGALRPFFSPDGAWLGYEVGSTETGDAEIRKLPLAGGPSVAITRGSFRGASWQPDGTIVLGSTRGLYEVSSGGGAPRALTTPAEGESHWSPQPFPGGMLFQVWTGSLPETRIEAIDLATGERRRLVEGTGPLLSGKGHLLFGRGDSLWGVPFDARRLAVTGEPVRLMERIDNARRGEAVYALSEGGDLVYRTPDTTAVLRRAVWVDRAGQETPIPLPEHNLIYPRISPDGTRLAYGAADIENEDVWLFDLARAMPIRFTFHPAQELDVVWSADGRHILFHSHRDGAGNMYRQAANGTGSIERLTTVAAEQIPAGVSADGRFLLLTVETSDAGFDIHLLALDRGGEAVPLLATPANEAAAELSPDGRYLAYVSDESGRDEVYVRPFPDIESDRFQVSSGGGQSPLFSRDGRELFFSVAGSLKRVGIETAGGFRAGPVETVLEGPYLQGRTDERQYDISPDGARFVMLREVAIVGDDSASVRLKMVLDWREELERAAPTSR
jgi:eukaryotic-like serine/threonine-protein kinase